MEMHEQPTLPIMGEDPLVAHDAPTEAHRVQREPRRRGLSRRALFTSIAGAGAVAVGGAGLVAWGEQGGGPLPQLAQNLGISGVFPTRPETSVQVGHLLRRAGFGASPQEVKEYSALGYQGAVDRLLNSSQDSDAELENRLKGLNIDLNQPREQQRWWLLRMIYTNRPLVEKMTLFWHGFLTSSYTKVGGKQYYTRMITQNNFLRSHAFDSFDTLLLGITADPAMLVYLDLTKSRKNAPNENYARELMELFTLGLGKYTQQDVYEAASALTGWHVSKDQTGSQFVAADHNTAEKTYLGQKGNFDYKDVIRILTNHPDTPWFVCKHLFTFFCYENPSQNDLKPLVDSYNQSNHNMGAVMKTLLLSPQFQSDKAYRSRIKSPTEFVVGIQRALGIQGNGNGLPAEVMSMGQELFNPPNVAGWPADKVSAYWLNSGTWMARLNYINLVLMGTKAKNVSYPGLDLQKLVNDQHISTPEQFVDYFSSFLLDGRLDAGRKSELVSYFTTSLQSGTQATTAVSTKAGKKGKTEPQITLGNGKSYPISNVRGALYLLLSLPEYQLN
ncbi:DUF1800 domain-containing protein [Tengunoibacter tsumagoiensis]|uniref:DUF1800 domain-containing protein n=1 Tax=Tengunoibacter tsumagoiensis TaxID=2014871 RepID=A0A402A2E0_9CHLR|nr:DUF1800 domain-containing protein [Tengunoibacter tsumagoiensis]GCE13328.1 hypothetical protein KTT_31870 [Tengunoibacter tsumagoiensis]